MSRQPAVTFEMLPGWFEVPVRGDVGRWAKDTAQRAFEIVDSSQPGADAQRLEEALATLATHAVQHRPAQAFVYCPDPAVGPRLQMEVVTMPAPAELTPEVFTEWLAADDDLRFRPDDIEPFTARAGVGLRATQRWVDAESHVYETWYYSWRLAGYDVLVVASTTLADLTLAGLVRPEVDTFMAQLDVEGPDQAGVQV